MMTGVQTADLKVTSYDGAAWSLGLSLVREPRAATAMLSAGAFGHGGAYGTQVWADPRTQSLYLFLIQRWKPRAAEAAQIRTRFLEVAAGAAGAIPR